MMRTMSIGTAIEFVLLDAERETHLHDLAPVSQLDDAYAVVVVIRPRFHKCFEVSIHDSRNVRDNMPANGPLGNCGRRFQRQNRVTVAILSPLPSTVNN